MQAPRVPEWVPVLSLCLAEYPQVTANGTRGTGWAMCFSPCWKWRVDCLPLPQITLKNECDLSRPSETNLGFRLRRAMFMDSDLLFAPRKWLSRVRLWQVWPSWTLGVCVCMDWGLSVCYRSRSWRVIRRPQRLVISADPNSSGASKDSRSHLFWSKCFVDKAGCRNRLNARGEAQDPGTVWTQVKLHIAIGGTETADGNIGVCFPFHVSDPGMDKPSGVLTFWLLLWS